MRNGDGPGTEEQTSYDVEDVLTQLDELEDTVNRATEEAAVKQTRRMVERLPGSGRIRKYTSRDVAEGLVGGIVFSLPLLVEDGVFEIAEWFIEVSVGPMPVFLVINVLFVVTLVTGLLYYTDIREVQMRRLFGVVPSRLAATLVVSFVVALTSMLLWGRLHEEDPSTIEQFSRVTVIWAAAALGATLGDILPGESTGEDIGEQLDKIGE